MADLPNDRIEPSSSPLRALHPFFRTLGAVDDAIYAFERAFATGALVIMTLAVFLKIIDDFVEKQLLTIHGSENLGPPGPAYAALGALLLFSFVASWKAGQVAAGPDADPIKPLFVGALGAAGAFAFGFAIVTLESNLICLLLSLATGAILIHQIVRPRLAAGDDLMHPRVIFQIGVTVLLVVALIYASHQFEGYSWTGPVSLTLLMWMAFIGASMATYQRRHLNIDAIRKAIPADKIHLFNAVGFLVTAIATAAFFYLSWIYFQQRFHDVAEPGKIPDWVTLLSIPFALALVTVRFFMYSIGELILGLRGHVPEAPSLSEEVA